MSRAPEPDASAWLEEVCARAAVLLAQPDARARADEMLGRPDSALPRDDDGRTPVLPFDIGWKHRDLALSTGQKYGVVVILAFGWRPARPSWFVPRDDWPEPKQRDRTAADARRAEQFVEQTLKLSQVLGPATAAVESLLASLRLHPSRLAAAKLFYLRLLCDIEGDRTAEPATGEQTFTTGDLLEKTGYLSSESLAKHYGAAGVRLTRRGERDRRFTLDEARRILTAVATRAGEARIRDRANASVQTLQEMPHEIRKSAEDRN